MILITGATGNLGYLTLIELLKLKASKRYCGFSKKRK